MEDKGGLILSLYIIFAKVRSTCNFNIIQPTTASRSHEKPAAQECDPALNAGQAATLFVVAMKTEL